MLAGGVASMNWPFSMQNCNVLAMRTRYEKFKMWNSFAMIKKNEIIRILVKTGKNRMTSKDRDK